MKHLIDITREVKMFLLPGFDLSRQTIIVKTDNLIEVKCNQQSVCFPVKVSGFRDFYPEEIEYQHIICI